VNVTDRLSQKLFTARTLAGAGIVTPTRPDRILKAVRALHAFGPTPAAGYTVSAIRHPDATALVDDLGTLTFAEVHRRTNALANSLRARGVGEGSSVAIMCRNHRGFIDTTVALSKLGAHALYLNTAFAGPQITEVAEREQPTAIVYDAEFENLVHDAGKGRQRFIAWHDADEPSEDPRLEDLIRTGDTSDLEAPGRKGRVVILTSGTTGSPKGAQRRQPESLDPAAALFSMIPLRAREHTMLAAPMFHSWGFAHFTLGMALSSTLVKRAESPGVLVAFWRMVTVSLVWNAVLWSTGRRVTLRDVRQVLVPGIFFGLNLAVFFAGATHNSVANAALIGSLAPFLIVPMGGSTIAEAFPSLVRDLGMLAIGLAAYGAVFALVGTRIKRPLIVGLVLISHA